MDGQKNLKNLLKRDKRWVYSFTETDRWSILALDPLVILANETVNATRNYFIDKSLAGYGKNFYQYIITAIIKRLAIFKRLLVLIY